MATALLPPLTSGKLFHNSICLGFALRDVPPFAHIVRYAHYLGFAQGANGECEGKAPEGPAPLTAAQRK